MIKASDIYNRAKQLAESTNETEQENVLKPYTTLCYTKYKKSATAKNYRELVLQTQEVMKA